MPATNPRINVVVGKDIYLTVQNIAKANSISMSMVVRDLVKEAIELREDILLSKFADERMSLFNSKKTLSHKSVWK